MAADRPARATDSTTMVTGPPTLATAPPVTLYCLFVDSHIASNIPQSKGTSAAFSAYVDTTQKDFDSYLVEDLMNERTMPAANFLKVILGLGPDWAKTYEDRLVIILSVPELLGKSEVSCTSFSRNWRRRSRKITQ